MTVASQSASLWSGILLTALLWAFARATPSISMDYCATINTASGAANHSIYQSDGLCHDFCQDKWAIAIVKGDSCWCSNFVPDESVQVDTSQCSNPCPGYITDVCGGDTEYGYMLLAKSPSGTVGGTTSTTTTPTTSASPDQVTTHLLTSVVQQTVQQTVRATVTYTPPTSASSSTRQSSSSPTSAAANEQTTSQVTTSESTTSSSSTTEPPQRTTVTVGGTVQTIVITPTASPQGSSSSSSADINSHGTKHGLSAGAAAGVAIAVVVILLAIGGGIAWFLIKRRRKAAADLGGAGSLSHRGSSSGIMAAPGVPEVAETRYYMGSPTNRNNDSNPPPGPERRRSTLMPVDPRLDPFSKGIYNRTENRSHESVNTLEDNQDYSRRIQEPPRVLRATNPDPDYD